MEPGSEDLPGRRGAAGTRPPARPRDSVGKKPAPAEPALFFQNVTANHRANDVIAAEDGPQVLVGRFMYGPLDMVALTGEKVRGPRCPLWAACGRRGRGWQGRGLLTACGGEVGARRRSQRGARGRRDLGGCERRAGH